MRHLGRENLLSKRRRDERDRMSRIIRVFPRRTKATPDDDLVRIGCAPTLFDEADEVHISVTFTWDLKLAEQLVRAWSPVAKTLIGGPATGEQSNEFIPGRYVKSGYVITSRGCNNSCWFCSVWKREGSIRELAISRGWNVLDDNLISCSREHQLSVFEMLRGQKNVEFTGGLEAKLLTPWHIEQFARLNIKQMFFAYDTPDDYEPLVQAGKMLAEANITYANRKARAYVLCGYPNDTFDDADKRMRQTVSAGFMPMAMLYRGQDGSRDREWMKWQRQWARPAIISSMMKEDI